MERKSRGAGDLRDPSPDRNNSIRRSNWGRLQEIKAVRHRPSKIGDDAWPNNLRSNSAGIVRSMIPAAGSTTSCCQGADLLRIPVAWPLNGEIISAKPTLVRVREEPQRTKKQHPAPIDIALLGPQMIPLGRLEATQALLPATASIWFEPNE